MCFAKQRFWDTTQEPALRALAAAFAHSRKQGKPQLGCPVRMVPMRPTMTSSAGFVGPAG
jgi:hypothetical protein